MESHLNVLLRENRQLREALQELIHAAELYMGETPDGVIAKARAALGVTAPGGETVRAQTPMGPRGA